MMSLTQALLDWYTQAARALPWRGHADAYVIWVAETMLQQTRVETVIPYFERWMQRFPTLQALAAASEAEVLRLWEGLGYYSRARHLWRAARIVQERYGGEIPSDVRQLRLLPGIGAYTAAAIASFAFGRDEVTLDGNLKRVLARLFDLDFPLNTPEAHQRLEALARAHLPAGRSAEYNQALMDLGAIICLPRRPRCERCPLADFCLARARDTIGLRPVKPLKPPLPLRHQVSAVILESGAVLLARRPQRGLLAGLWEFPSAFVEDKDGEERLSAALEQRHGLRAEPRRKWGMLHHAYTHFRVRVEIWECTLRAAPPAELEWVSLPRLADYPMGKIDRQIARQIVKEESLFC